MGTNTKIEWAHHTFNPWIGCTKVSPACDNCYAENMMDSRLKVVQWGAGQPRKRTGDANWKQPLEWNKKAAANGIRYRVFCASLADVFDNEVPTAWRVDLFRLIENTPHLDWLLLTKRIGNVDRMIDEAGAIMSDSLLWPMKNVWLGATICNQEEADRDIPKLLAVPAAKRFLSIEPLLASIDLESACDIGERLVCAGSWNEHAEPQRCLAAIRHCSIRLLDWVIVGGESGNHARPMHPDWVRSLRDQCHAAGVAFHFKQWGEYHTLSLNVSTGDAVFRQFTSHQQWVNKATTWVNGGICIDRHGQQLKNGGDFKRAQDAGAFPVTVMHRVGKANAGRILDGRTFDEFPSQPNVVKVAA